MNTAFWILVGAAGASVVYGCVRAVRWAINDTNSYYEQCRIDAIDEAEFKRTGRWDWETDEDVLEREAYYAAKK